MGPNGDRGPPKGGGRPPSRASYEAFHENFLVKVADSDEEVERCQRLRYRVYCVERHWCEEVRSVDGREFDRFDARSAHALLMHRPTDELVGTVRLVLPSGDSASPDLPMEEVTGWPPPFAVEPLPVRHLGEVSRFAVTKSFLLQEIRNQRAGEDSTAPSDVVWRGEDRALPNVSIGLMRGIVLMARPHDITHICATLDPALVKLFARIDVHFTACGKPREYHGVRQPCHARIEDIAEAMKARRPNLHRIVFGDAPSDVGARGGRPRQTAP